MVFVYDAMFCRNCLQLIHCYGYSLTCLYFELVIVLFWRTWLFGFVDIFFSINKPGTDLISLLILLLWQPLHQVQGLVISDQIGMKFSRIVLHVNTHRLMESDFWFDVVISRWRPWRHFTLKSAATWCVHTKCLSTCTPMQQCTSVADLQCICIRLV